MRNKYKPIENGFRFGDLKVLEPDEPVEGHSTWVCVCDCGTVVYGVRSYLLSSGKKWHCGCKRSWENYGKQTSIKPGEVYNQYTVIKRAGSALNGAALWLCRCTCGIEKVVMGGNLVSGGTKSCGCRKKTRRKQ